MNTTTNPTGLLMDEHEIIMQADKAINLLDSLWLTDPDSYKKNATLLLRFFAEYSDKFHHQKEEQVLFDEMNNHPEFILQEIIGELEEHHEMFRVYAADIKEALEANDYPEAHKVFKKYMNELQDHIAVENDELFSMADSLFSEEELDKIYFRFKDIDMELNESEKINLAKIPGDIIASLG